MNTNLDRINKAFWALSKTAEGRDQITEVTDLYLRLKIREDAFWRTILPPKVLDRRQCTRSMTHDGLVKIIDIEPDASGAMAIDWRGDTGHKYVKGNRYEVPFYKIETPIQEMKEADEFVYEMPITEIIRYLTEKDVAKTEDTIFMSATNAAVAETGKLVSSANATFTKKDLIPLFNQLDGNQNKAAVVLMTLSQFNNALAWDNTDFGSDLLSKVTVDGFQTTKLLGRTLVVTNKNDIVKDHELYTYGIPKMLGHAFLLEEDLKFDVETEFDTFRYKSWEYIAASIGNVDSIAKLELTH